MYNDQLVYKVVIWVFFGISLWKEKVALSDYMAYMFEVLCSTTDIIAYKDSINVNFLTVSPAQSSTMWVILHLGWR